MSTIDYQAAKELVAEAAAMSIEVDLLSASMEIPPTIQKTLDDIVVLIRGSLTSDVPLDSMPDLLRDMCDVVGRFIDESLFDLDGVTRLYSEDILHPLAGSFSGSCERTLASQLTFFFNGATIVLPAGKEITFHPHSNVGDSGVRFECNGIDFQIAKENFPKRGIFVLDKEEV